MTDQKGQEKKSGRVIRFGLLGAGWRSEFYLRIAAACPEKFELVGVWVRDALKGEELEKRWGVRTFRTWEELWELGRPDFLISAVARVASAQVLRELAGARVPVLAETSLGADVEDLPKLYEDLKGAPLQFAEQYAFQPQLAAVGALVDRGELGRLSQAQLSVAHGHHAIALFRRYLGWGWETVSFRGGEYHNPVLQGPDRAGWPEEEALVESVQQVVQLRSGLTWGVYDFSFDQYFSPIRGPRWLLRGERGEICQGEVRTMKDFCTPVAEELRRVESGQGGSLTGKYLEGILCGGEWVYRNPLAPARLTDEEIAIGTCILKMDTFVREGEPFYPLESELQDHYLSGLLSRAAENGGELVESTPQRWMNSGDLELA